MSVRLLHRTRRACAHARVAAITLAVATLAAGCAVNSGPSKVAGPMVGFPGDPPPPKPVVQVTKVEIEADGLPSQLAPKHRTPMADDPSEPWSPNYGRNASESAAPIAPAKVSAAAPLMPIKAMATEALQRPSPPLDPDDVIRLAVAEHEMRHR